MKKRIVVLASGSGSNFQSIIDSIKSGFLDAEVTRLIVNRDHIGAIERATNEGIPVDIITQNPLIDFDKRLLKSLDNANPDLIVLAGFLVKLPHLVIDSYRGKIINIHPSLLPKYGGKGFYGMKVHNAVIADQQIISGCTIHLVTEEFDEGPILAQRTVPVHENDTAEELAKRVLSAEHQLLPETIKYILET